MDKYEHRRARLRELIDRACGGRTATFAKAIERSDSYASRMLYPTGKPGGKRIGDDMVTVIEQAFRLRRAWLDMPLGEDLPPAPAPQPASTVVAEPPRPWGSSRWPFELVTEADYAQLTHKQREHVESTILMLLGATTRQADDRKSSAATGR